MLEHKMSPTVFCVQCLAPGKRYNFGKQWKFQELRQRSGKWFTHIRPTKAIPELLFPFQYTVLSPRGKQTLLHAFNSHSIQMREAEQHLKSLAMLLLFL